MHVQLTDVFDRCTVFYQKFFKFRALQASPKHHSPRPRPCRQSLLLSAPRPSDKRHWHCRRDCLQHCTHHVAHDSRRPARLATCNARRATLPVATDVARPGGDDLRRVGDQFHPKVPLRPACAFRAATHRVGDPACSAARAVPSAFAVRPCADRPAPRRASLDRRGRVAAGLGEVDRSADLRCAGARPMGVGRSCARHGDGVRGRIGVETGRVRGCAHASGRRHEDMLSS